MSDWFATLDGLWGAVWSSLSDGVAQADHPARLPTFATTGPDGWPEARTIVLRSADQQGRTLTAHTDLHSSKIASLRAHPRAAFHVWLPALDLQIRAQADVTITHGPQVRDLWKAVPDHARQSYGVTPAPGTPIPHALAYVKEPDPATFAVLTCSLTQIDAVHLGTHHRRAAWSRSDDWSGQWLSP